MKKGGFSKAVAGVLWSNYVELLTKLCRLCESQGSGMMNAEPSASIGIHRHRLWGFFALAWCTSSGQRCLDPRSDAKKIAPSLVNDHSLNIQTYPNFWLDNYCSLQFIYMLIYEWMNICESQIVSQSSDADGRDWNEATYYAQVQAFQWRVAASRQHSACLYRRSFSNILISTVLIQLN